MIALLAPVAALAFVACRCCEAASTTIVVSVPTSQKMERAHTPHNPVLEIWRLRIPGPAIPFVLAGFPLVVRPLALRHLLFYPASKVCLRYSLAIVHLLLLYIHLFRGDLNKKEAEHTNTLPLLEYLSLVLGEAALQESNFWLYTSVAMGWIHVLPHSSFSQMLSLWSRRAWILLILSIPSVLQMSKRLSTGAMLSALSLFTKIVSLILTGSVTLHEISATTSVGVLLLLLARPCCSKFLRIARSQPWLNRLGQAHSNWLRSVQQDGMVGFQLGSCTRCAQAAVAMLTLQGAGWILSSFIWSCFPWRWLFNKQVSRNPSWTVFSFLAGFLFFPILALIKFLQARGPVADLGVFVHNQLIDCLAATWWTSCIYLLLWSICEIVNRAEQN
jgi:hypothetical protein